MARQWMGTLPEDLGGTVLSLSPGRGGPDLGGEGLSQSHMALQGQVFVAFLGESTLRPQS